MMVALVSGGTSSVDGQIVGTRESKNLRLLGYTDLGVRSFSNQVIVQNNYAYVGRNAYPDDLECRGGGTSVVDVSDPLHPKVVANIPLLPYTVNVKVQVRGNILVQGVQIPGSVRRAIRAKRLDAKLVEPSRREIGLRIFDVSTPSSPEKLATYQGGGEGGFRRAWFDGRYAYACMGREGYQNEVFEIVDLRDPRNPKMVSRWWYPGQHTAAGEKLPPGEEDQGITCHVPHVEGNRAYIGYGTIMVILDISDLTQPKLAGEYRFSRAYRLFPHTVLPIRGGSLAVVTQEEGPVKCENGVGYSQAWMFDLRDEKRPIPISTFPIPEGDYCLRGGRFAPHNIFEGGPGSPVDDRMIYLAYSNAGVRIYDVLNAYRPTEVAYWVPEAPPGSAVGDADIGDLYVDERGLIYATDRQGGGLWILQFTAQQPVVDTWKKKERSQE